MADPCADVAAGVPPPRAVTATEVSGRRIAIGALAVLGVLYVGLAVATAAPGSNLVLATVGGSPGWLLGPWRAFGASGADGAAAGPLFYAGLWAALLAYVGVLAAARAIGPRLAFASIAACHLLFLLAPPLLSQDVFSYISYARLGVLHSLNPYTTSPDAVPQDAAFAFAGSKDATSVYGPLFTLATYPLAKVSVPVAFWTLKSVAASASLAVTAITYRCAERLGTDPVFAALLVGLNPLVLVHVVAGAHNDALLVLLLMTGIAAALASSERASGALTTAGTAVKASGALVVPFLLAGVRRKAKVIAGCIAAAAAIAVASFIAFGLHAFDALGLIGSNQERTSRWSIPQRSADGIGSLFGGSPDTIVHFTRAAFVLAFVAIFLVLLRRAWRRSASPGEWVRAAGWATLALLLASAWLVPWYAIWVLPLAALSRSRALVLSSIALCAYMLVIAVPL